MKKFLLLTTTAIFSSQAMAAAYKIPEQSVNSTALSGAYIANAQGADANYYNPAAMVFNEDGASIEGDLTVIHLSSIGSENSTPGFAGSDDTERETFLAPTFHYVSPIVNNARFGLSVITPAGLSKRWKGINRAFAEEFTLKTIEFNPSMGYKLNDQLSVGFGFRAVYSEGVVKSSNTANPFVTVGRDLEGDSWDMGLNFALHYRPVENLNLAATYRTKVDLTVEGNAELFGAIPPGNPGAGTPLPSYDDGATVSVPIPAALNLAAAYTFNDRTTVELVYERTYWSAYKALDFNYDTPLNAVFTAAFDSPKIKDWDDTNTYRIGITHKLNDRWTLMGGFAYDETPTPEKYAGYELPDTDARIYSLGARYQYSDRLNIGFGLLYDDKETLDLKAGENGANSGSLLGGAKFTDAAAYLFTAGLNYKF
ncbi:MAG: transporter [Chromatiaceae bacterium]|nr:transporter [Gammaproteobacteria bacterium]MCB1881364.1 transporter [Gammaproteobacteria bacterium]MCP5446231.1 transporter [Chromatiaceae bacterium]